MSKKKVPSKKSIKKASLTAAQFDMLAAEVLNKIDRELENHTFLINTLFTEQVEQADAKLSLVERRLNLSELSMNAVAGVADTVADSIDDISNKLAAIKYAFNRMKSAAVVSPDCSIVERSYSHEEVKNMSADEYYQKVCLPSGLRKR